MVKFVVDKFDFNKFMGILMIGSLFLSGNMGGVIVIVNLGLLS